MRCLMFSLTVFMMAAGCTAPVPPQDNVPAKIPYSEDLSGLVGKWLSNGIALFEVAQEGSDLVLSVSRDDKWQSEVSGLQAEAGTLKFTLKRTLKSGKPHALNGMPFACTLKPVEGNPDEVVYSSALEGVGDPGEEILKRQNF